MQVFSQTACDQFVHAFSVSQELCNSRVISFKNLNAAATSVEWDLGDGNSSSGMEISHEYSAFGDYQVKMVVRYANGCTGEVIKNVPVFFTLKNDLISSEDQTICVGEKVQLMASTNNAEFCWLAAEGLTDLLQKNPFVQPTITTNYRFQTRYKGENLIYNSGFEQGNIGFRSDYEYKPITDFGESQYSIVTNPLDWHFGFEACSDHTLGFGNLMVVNGASEPNSIVWSQTVKVIPNTTYELALWISSVNRATPAKLRFKINGKIIGDEVNAGENACDWNQFSTFWNSEYESTAEIVIINVNTAVSGNDFALDDITFFAHNIFYDEVTVNVKPEFKIKIGSDVTICEGQSIQLNGMGDVSASSNWAPVNGLSDPTIRNPIATPDKTTNYILTAISPDGCESSDTVTVNVKAFTGNKIYVPTAFTPNGDGKNDCFGLRNANITYPFQFEVYNRLGQKVFTTSNTDICWDGTFKGILQPGDAFVWQIKIITECGDIYKKGTVVLIR